jgi:ATP-dependent DNA ligase
VRRLGVTDFERLRSALAHRGSRDAFLYAFDPVELDGRDMRARRGTGAEPT